MKLFVQLVDEALRFVQEADSKNVKEEDLEKYVQHRVLRRDICDGVLILEGETRNLTTVAFGFDTERGKGRGPSIGLVVKDSEGNPLPSENSFRGSLNEGLRRVSRMLHIGDPRCGWFCEDMKQKLDCGRCLRCGIMGFLLPGEKGFPHRLSISAGKPIKAVVSRRPRLNVDSVTGMVVYPEKDKRNEEDKRKSTAYFWQEVVEPENLSFKMYLTFENMAPGEIGLVLTQAHLAWGVIGLGRGRTGKFETWKHNPGRWGMTYFSPIGIVEDVIKGRKLAETVEKLEQIAHISVSKRLFREYELFVPQRPQNPFKE